MDVIALISNILGGACIIIGILLVPMAVWFLRPALKNRDRVSLVIGVLVLLLATGCFAGAWYLFTQGLIQQVSMPWNR